MFLRLCSVAPRMPSTAAPRIGPSRDRWGLRRLACAILRSAGHRRHACGPERYSAVSVDAFFSSSGEPKNTISPPRSPGPGPMSRSLSASSMICGSCSTTTRELPASRSRFITSITRPMSPRMQSDGRLIEHEERVHERRSERRREVDALHLSARERPRLAVEREVSEPHLLQVAQARADLGEQQLGGFVERRGQRQALEETREIICRQQHEVADRFAFDAPQQGFGLRRAPSHAEQGVYAR